VVNRYQIKYWRMVSVKFLLNLLAGKKKSDFDWNAYHFHYEGELKDVEKEYTLILKNEDYVSKEGRIIF